jgi:undecaprenyl-diphosphatase
MDFEDTELYRDITDAAHDTPTWVQHTVEIWTEAGILLFAVLCAAAWWRARRETTRVFAIAALAPLATAVAYVCSELLKSGFTEERPCRAVAGAAPSIAACPPSGDWSFPSNHATIAGAAAVALAVGLARLAAVRVARVARRVARCVARPVPRATSVAVCSAVCAAVAPAPGASRPIPR